MLVAELDANGWVAIIGALGIIILQVVKMLLDYHREKVKAARDAVVADRVTEVAAMQARAAQAAVEVKNTLANATKVTDRKLESVAAKIEEVHKATNSLTDRLVEATGKEGVERGVREERERATRKAEERHGKTDAG